MLALIVKLSFPLLCIYGVVWALVLNAWRTERRSSIPYMIYFFGFVGLAVPASSWAYGGAMGAGGQMAVVGGVLIGTVLVAVAFMFNSIPILFCVGQIVRVVGREAAGLDQMTRRKSYDRAEAAESRGDPDEAARLYREEMAADPADTVAPRRLADLLVKAGRAQDAVAELRALLELIEDKDEMCSTMFRLAEILDEQLHDRSGAAELYGRIVKEHPKRRLAEYARQRLGTNT